MVRIPYIKIPSVRVGGIDPTSDIGTAIGGVQPTPITCLLTDSENNILVDSENYQLTVQS